MFAVVCSARRIVTVYRLATAEVLGADSRNRRAAHVAGSNIAGDRSQSSTAVVLDPCRGSVDFRIWGHCFLAVEEVWRQSVAEVVRRRRVAETRGGKKMTLQKCNICPGGWVFIGSEILWKIGNKKLYF